MNPINCNPQTAKPLSAADLAALSGQTLCIENFLDPLGEFITAVCDGTIFPDGVLGSRAIELNAGQFNNVLNPQDIGAPQAPVNLQCVDIPACASSKLFVSAVVNTQTLNSGSGRITFKLLINGTPYAITDTDATFLGDWESLTLTAVAPALGAGDVVCIETESTGPGGWRVNTAINVVEL